MMKDFRKQIVELTSPWFYIRCHTDYYEVSVFCAFELKTFLCVESWKIKLNANREAVNSKMLLQKALVISLLIGFTFSQPIWNIEDTQLNSGEQLLRSKRFLALFNPAFAAGRGFFEYLRDQGDFRFCGYNRVGTPVYTNGNFLLCSGNCPKDDYTCNWFYK